MSISIDTYCLQCLLRRNIALAQTLGTEEQAMAFAKEIMKLCINAPEGVSSPWFGPQIADLLHDMYGLDYDRFRQEKLDSNRFVLERLPAIREKVTNAKDPVFAGLQFAILGNYLDFSALQGQVSFEKLEEMLDKALEMELDDQVYAYLCRDLRRGGKLVYLTDNAGEIGFDRVLAEAIAAAYPDISVTFCVRGAIAQNDATREDAAAVGIPFPVIDNGNRVAGTQLDMLSEEAAAAQSEAARVSASDTLTFEQRLILLVGRSRIGIMFTGALFLLVTAFAALSVGVFASAVFRRTVTATVMAYLLVFLIGVVTLLPMVLGVSYIGSHYDDMYASTMASSVAVIGGADAAASGLSVNAFIYSPAVGLMALIADQTGLLKSTLMDYSYTMYRIYDYLDFSAIKWENMPFMAGAGLLLDLLAACFVRPREARLRRRSAKK